MLAWAKWWQSLGCAVYPLPPLRKKPSVGGLGIRSATTDIAQIEAWWTAQPDANIGVVGDPAATARYLLRVDVDPKRSGDVAWQALIREHGCTDTLTIKTPSGGFHYYFYTDRAYGNGTGTLPTGIDIRGHQSGYTVGAPSSTMHIKGESEAGRYELIEQRPITYAPDWLLSMLDATKRAESPVEAVTSVDDETYLELRDALLSPGMLRDWARWSDNGLALRSLGDRGYQLWTEYSQQQLALFPEHAGGTDTAETWWGRHGTTGLKSDYRSIFARAQAGGWKNPKSLDPATLGFGQATLPAGASVTPPPRTQKKFQVLSKYEFMSGADPEWRVDGLLPQVGLAMIYGPSGVGKSFMALDLLEHIADGRDYGIKNRTVKQGKCVYVMGEGAGGMRQRVRAYNHVHPTDHDNFKIISAAPNLMTPEDVGELATAIMEAGGAQVVCLDTLHSMMAGGDENSAKDMGILLANARVIADTLKCLIVFIHHTGKDEAKGARGSSAIRAAMETEIEILQNSNDPSRRVASITKQRDGDDNISWEYTLDPVIVMGENAFSSAIVKHSERALSNEPKRSRNNRDQDFVVEALQKCESQYPEGVPLEVLVANISRDRIDMLPTSIRRSITRSIDRGAISINSESVIKLAWVN